MSRLPRIIAPVIILALGVWGMFWLGQQKTKPKRTKTERLVAVVRTAKVGSPIRDLTLETFGTIVPRRVATISAEVGGRIVYRHPQAVRGRFLPANTELLRVDGRIYLAEVERRKQAIAQAKLTRDQLILSAKQTKERLDVANRQVKLAQQELARTQLLARRNATAQREVNRAELVLLQSQQTQLGHKNTLAQIPLQQKQAQLHISLAEVEHQNAVQELAKTRIKTPFAGIVTEADVAMGDVVKPGVKLFRVEEVASLEIEFQLKPKQLQLIRQASGEGNPFSDNFAHVRLAVRADGLTLPKTWPATIDRLVRIDPQTQMATLRGKISGAERPVSGMFMRVSVQVTQLPSMVKIPIEAWRPQNQLWTIQGGRLQVHTIEPIQIRAKSVVIELKTDGPQPGDALVISPLRVAYTGMPVESRAESEAGQP